MLIVKWDALGFSTASGNIFPFSVDLSDFCKNYRVRRSTTIDIYISHDVLLIDEARKIIERNRFLEKDKIWCNKTPKPNVEIFESFVGSSEESWVFM